MFRKIIFAVILILLVLSACTQTSSPPDVVQQYLTALVTKDDIKVVNLSCAAWEEGARADSASFTGVQVTLEDAACEVKSEEGQSAVVSCTGNLRYSYAGGEEKEISLDRRNYLVVLEGDGWRMCGYQ